MEYQSEVPPINPPSPPVKKGLHPMAWVGIGCGGLALLAVIIVVAAGIWGANKAKELGVDFKNNPEGAAAELVVSMSPDLEKVSSDKEAGTITIRTKDGKVQTFTYEEISSGKYLNPSAETPAADPAVEAPTE